MNDTGVEYEDQYVERLAAENKKRDEEQKVAWGIVSEVAEAGAKWLDEQRPGWYDEIDVDSLEMSQPDACIAGQVFMDKINGYRTGFDYLSDGLLKDAHRVDQLGFDLPDAMYEFDYVTSTEGYSLLGEAWVEEIMSRRFPWKKMGLLQRMKARLGFGKFRP